jgi:hypothetical protein
MSSSIRNGDPFFAFYRYIEPLNNQYSCGDIFLQYGKEVGLSIYVRVQKRNSENSIVDGLRKVQSTESQLPPPTSRFVSLGCQ